ncbi:Beta-galactosidase 5, partial [Glycine soja]
LLSPNGSMPSLKNLVRLFSFFIIFILIENEYGAQSKLQGAAGQNYVNWAAKMAVEMGTGVPWVMCKEDNAPYLVDGLRITYFWIKEQIEKEKAQENNFLFLVNMVSLNVL